MGRFEQSIRLRRTGAGRHQAQIGPEWCIAGAPNGGYLMALCLQALGACCARPHPVAATAHYLARSSPGQASVQSRLLRRGRALETAEAVLSQGSAQVKCVGTFGDLGEIDGPEFIEQPAPEWPAPEDCVPVANLFPPAAGLAREIDMRLPPDNTGWTRGETAPRGELRLWQRFTDESDGTLPALALFGDTSPPAVYAAVGMHRWVPTIEYSVQFRASPAPGWLQCRFLTRYLTRGLLEEDGEIWDSHGRLVALTRQLAWLRDG